MDERTNRTIAAYIDGLMEGSTAEAPLWNLEKIRSGRPNKWNYIDGCMIKAILAMHEITGESRYLEFADRFMSGFVTEDGTIRTYDPEEQNLDMICPGTNLITLYERTGKEKYRKAADCLRRGLDEMPRTHEGSFWHKKIYPWQVWLDGLYMAQPFYMTYETKYDGMKGCTDSFGQFVRVRKYMRDEATGLYYHGYDESRSMYWADPQTGCSPSFWLRAIGWFACALVETADCMDETLYYERRTLQSMLRELTEALLPWQGADGMFSQVVNYPDEPGNYPETSGSALITYALLKGVRTGMLPDSYEAPAKKAFGGITARYLKTGTDENGRPKLSLGGICLVAGLGGKDHRDGTRAYYYSEPVVEDEAKGTAPYILAYTELLRR